MFAHTCSHKPDITAGYVRISDAEVEDLFHSLDANADGGISLEELRGAAKRKQLGLVTDDGPCMHILSAGG
eukprot:179462-Chlamydomonas_euryale.AAC.2